MRCKAGICECLNANYKQLLHCTKLCIYLCVWVGTLKIGRQKIVLVCTVFDKSSRSATTLLNVVGFTVRSDCLRFN